MFRNEKFQEWTWLIKLYGICVAGGVGIVLFPFGIGSSLLNPEGMLDFESIGPLEVQGTTYWYSQNVFVDFVNRLFRIGRIVSIIIFVIFFCLAVWAFVLKRSSCQRQNHVENVSLGIIGLALTILWYVPPHPIKLQTPVVCTITPSFISIGEAETTRTAWTEISRLV
ncbi:MAG: hypothetical protein MN733_04340, partial [Nitrososphaera sp.]|nr:hypothetical protein [Nitrososphaera sp.]